jgi:hypothetical protein
MNGWMFSICLAVSPLNDDICTRLEQTVYINKEDCLREQNIQGDPAIRQPVWISKCQPTKIKKPKPK